VLSFSGLKSDLEVIPLHKMQIEFSGYFEHGADIGIVGRGETIENAFENVAVATFNIMANLKAVQANETLRFEFDGSDVELALVTWLNLLLGKARERGLILSRFQLIRNGTHWICSAWGQTWNRDIEHGTEVKGATLTCLSLRN
jgi:SHS2 domain-containing protein